MDKLINYGSVSKSKSVPTIIEISANHDIYNRGKKVPQEGEYESI